MALLRRLNAIADTLKHTQGEVRILRQMMDRIHRRTLAQSRQVAAVNSGTPASPANPALSVGTEAILSTSGSEVSSAHNKPSMIPFPKIEQFRHTCAEIAWHARKRVDEEAGVVDGEPSVPGEPDCPTVDFVGSVKLHGTNASICQRGPGGTMWCQSRQNVLSATRDNAQFFVYFNGQREGYERLMARLWQATQDPRLVASYELVFCTQRFIFLVHDCRDVSSDSVLSVYGEWCGKGVQKKVAISVLSKRFVVFDVSFSSNGRRHWMDPVVVKEAVLAERGNEFDLYHIQEFPTWNISVDFNNPKLVQNKLIELTEAVEKECPVAAAFGVSGVGEGIVWVGQAFGQVRVP